MTTGLCMDCGKEGLPTNSVGKCIFFDWPDRMQNSLCMLSLYTFDQCLSYRPDKGQECNSSLHFNETLIQVCSAGGKKHLKYKHLQKADWVYSWQNIILMVKVNVFIYYEIKINIW